MLSHHRQHLKIVHCLHILLLFSSNCLTFTLYYILSIRPSLGFTSSSATTHTLSLVLWSLCVFGATVALITISYRHRYTTSYTRSTGSTQNTAPKATKKGTPSSRAFSLKDTIRRLDPVLSRDIYADKPLPWVPPITLLETKGSPAFNWSVNGTPQPLPTYLPELELDSPLEMPDGPVRDFLPNTVYRGGSFEIGAGDEDTIGHITIMNDTGSYV